MKPTSEMTQQEAACFVNLKKAMNDAIMVKVYLHHAQNLAPNEDLEIRVSTCLDEIDSLMTDIRHAVQSLTN